MGYRLYNRALQITAPLARFYLGFSKHKALLQRFAPDVPTFRSAPLWIHACSVGEVQVTRPLIQALREHFPDVPLVLSAATASGKRLAQQIFPDLAVVWCPFDTVSAVRVFLDAATPRALLLVETELWPNLIRETRSRGIPTVIVNGRISEKHFARYLRLPKLFREVLRHVDLCCVQEPVYRDRFIALGMEPTRVVVAGNMKYDAVATTVPSEVQQRLRRMFGLTGREPVLVVGSSRPGDESLLRDAWRLLREEVPGLRLILVPRHVERAAEILALFDEPVSLRSQATEANPCSSHVILVDTVGELVPIYSLAAVAVVGGSFFPGVEGHNPLEPAGLGVATVFGPYMKNFAEPAKALCESGGAVQCEAESLLGTLRGLFSDEALRREMGKRAQTYILERQGSVARHLQQVSTVFTDRYPAAGQ